MKLNKRGIEKGKLVVYIAIAVIAIILFYIWFKVITPNVFPTT
jgi:hypothetical protein